MQGLILAERFYTELVKGILQQYNPKLRYSAALLGSGSEILGYDDAYSQDHHWGVRLQLFLSNADISLKDDLIRYFREKLPVSFLGYSTHWSLPDPNDNYNQFPQHGTPSQINHRIEIYTVSEFLQTHLGYPSYELTFEEWCVVSEHQLLELVEGKVFHDDITPSLSSLRSNLQYYPKPIWILKMIALWNEVSELFPLMGRSGFAEDNLGSQVLSNKLAYLGMRLLFTIWRKYTPYPKWFGRTFTELAEDTPFVSLINQILYSRNWKSREDALIKFFQQIGAEFNKLELITPIEFRKKQFFSRPQYIVDCENITTKLLALIEEKIPPDIHSLGTVNEVIRLSQPRDNNKLLRKFKSIYQR